MLRKTMLFLFIAAFSGHAWSGETIKVYLGQHSWSDACMKLVPEFEKETGIKVDLEVYAEQQLSQKLTVMFASGDSEVDVYLLRPPQEARLLRKNAWCEDLTPYIKDDAEYDFADFQPSSIATTNIDGVQTCIPIMNESQIIYYRKDLFEKNGLAVPRTFAELEEAAKKLTDKPNDFYGIVGRGARSPLVTQFSSYLYGFGGDFMDVKTRKSRIDTPEFIAAAEYYGRLMREYGPPGTLNMGWTQAIAVFQQGKAAMYIDASTQYPNLLDPARSKVADKTGIGLFPAGPKAHKFYDVTCWAIAMSSNSKKKDAAWKFIRWMTDKKRCTVIQGDYAVQGARMSVFRDPAGVKSYPPDMIETFAQTAKYSVGIDRPVVTQVEQARDIIGTVVNVAISGGNVKAAAAAADKSFQELIDRD